LQLLVGDVAAANHSGNAAARSRGCSSTLLMLLNYRLVLIPIVRKLCVAKLAWFLHKLKGIPGPVSTLFVSSSAHKS
jgi:hypothetical protein